MSETEQLVNFAINLAQVSAGAILPLFRKPIPVIAKDGPDWDPVTEADRGAEAVMREMIESHYPSHSIHGEEFGAKEGTGAYQWILDPVDGTRAFVAGMPTWATLIGLYRDGQPFIGIMNQPFVGDMFVGKPDGAWLQHRGRREMLRVRTPVPLHQARAGTTTPDRFSNLTGRDQLRTSVQLLRYGGDAYFFCMVAAGHLDLAIDPGLQTYDIAALIPIITGAGGAVSTFAGGNAANGGDIIAGSSLALIEEARALLNST